MQGVMSGDQVEVALSQRSKFKGKKEGHVRRVTKRSVENVVGRLCKINGGYGLKDVSHSWGQDLFLSKKSPKDADIGDIVAVQITDYPGPKKSFSGKIQTNMGPALEAQDDVRKVVFEMGAPLEFPPQVLKETQKFKDHVTSEDIKGRKDLRDLDLITIDGATAKDFDDAVYVNKNAKNSFRLIVAIADVSHYVRPKTDLDEEAYKRGTSIYLPGTVIPMLPEKLSNGLCSLNPNVDRLALVADMILDSTGALTKTLVYEAVIKSHARMTYGQAQEILDGRPNKEFPHIKWLDGAYELSQILMKKRFAKGSLSLDIPEVSVEVDDLGEPVDLVTHERIYAHKLIEEFMLMANVAVAQFLNRKKVPQVYRIHESPDPTSLGDINEHVARMASDKPQKFSSYSRLAEFISDLEGVKKLTLQNMLLRSLKQAKYSSQNVGHFGLAFSDYAHFTSPIRRYPDLLTHRILKSTIMPKSNVYKPYTEDDLSERCEVLSEYEQRAVKAERQVISIKKARFAQRLLGQELEGSVTSVVRFGVFITLDEYPLEGLIKVEELGKDIFDYNEESMSLVGRRSHDEVRVGDKFVIIVAGADTEKGYIDFQLKERLTKRKPNPLGQYGAKKKKFKKKFSPKNVPNKKSVKTKAKERAGKSQGQKKKKKKRSLMQQLFRFGR